MRVTLYVIATLALAACSTSGTEELASNDPDRLVCEYEKVTGQHRPERICMTASRRAELREATQTGLISRRGERPVPTSEKGGTP